MILYSKTSAAVSYKKKGNWWGKKKKIIALKNKAYSKFTRSKRKVLLDKSNSMEMNVRDDELLKLWLMLLGVIELMRIGSTKGLLEQYHCLFWKMLKETNIVITIFSFFKYKFCGWSWQCPSLEQLSYSHSLNINDKSSFKLHLEAQLMVNKVL